MKKYFLILCVFYLACSTPRFSNHSIFYANTMGDEITCRPFLIINGNARTLYDFVTFQDYLNCRKVSNFDSCITSSARHSFGQPETYKYEKRGNFVYAYLPVIIEKRDSSDLKVFQRIYSHYYTVDSVWKKIFSFIPNDTIITPSEIFNYDYQKTVYTGKDTTYKINNKRYTCGIFYEMISDVDTLYARDTLHIEKKNGVIFSERHITQIRNSIDKYPLQKGEYYRGNTLVLSGNFKDTNPALHWLDKLFKQEITDIKRIK